MRKVPVPNLYQITGSHPGPDGRATCYPFYGIIGGDFKKVNPFPGHIDPETNGKIVDALYGNSYVKDFKIRAGVISFDAIHCERKGDLHLRWKLERKEGDLFTGHWTLWGGEDEILSIGSENCLVTPIPRAFFR